MSEDFPYVIERVNEGNFVIVRNHPVIMGGTVPMYLVNARPKGPNDLDVLPTFPKCWWSTHRGYASIWNTKDEANARLMELLLTGALPTNQM